MSTRKHDQNSGLAGQVDRFRGMMFFDASILKAAVLKSPTDDEMKQKFLTFLEEMFGELVEDKLIDCMDVGLAVGRFVGCLITQSEFFRFLEIKNYIGNLDSCPAIGEEKVQGVKVNGVMYYRTKDGEVGMFECCDDNDLEPKFHELN